MSEIVNKLKQIRIKNGVTQTQLAKELKTSQAQISFVESGKQVPSLETVEKMANVLGAKLEVA